MRAVTISLFGFLVIAAIGIISFCDGKSSVLCIENERKALLKFKHDLIDPSNRLSSWADADQEDCCNWVGVFCNNLTGNVDELHLGFHIPSSLDPVTKEAEEKAYWKRSILRGNINPSLLDLKHLSFLDLSDNDFGEIRIPEFIGSLKSLTHLDLSWANFTRAIPHQLANLSKLQYLDLGGNYLLSESKNLQWVSGLSSLQHLGLNDVDLSEATNWQQVINKLPSLVELHLSDCSLSNVPHFPVSLNHSTLALLDLSENLLTSVPTWIFSLSGLVSIDLSVIDMVGGVIPNGFQNLSSLNYLDLSSNFFSPSSIPSWLSNLNHLRFLGLYQNRLQGNITSVISNLSSVIHLDLSQNTLDGIVPKSLESLCNLRELDLSTNNIEQEVSAIIESLSRCSLDTLESLNLGYNKFFGHLTEQLGQFKNLAFIDLSENSISGPIPLSIGKLSSLKRLAIGYNQLNGSLPQSFGQLENVELLDFSNNMLEGTVSEIHFSNLTRLRSLKASNNILMFKPSPSWIPSFQCETIEFGNCYLGPQFPQWLQLQENISSLDLSHAEISDVIPTWFWNLSTQFEYVNLSHNQLFGGIPYWPKSYVVDLSYNQFTGLLPPLSPDLGFLSLSRNSFSGSLSHFLICNASTHPAISILDIGSNLLSGKIPDCWKHWHYLGALNLENNNLTGELPGSLGSMRFLMLLNLQKNNLFGEVPSSLQHLASLKILDLSENQLSGSIPAWIGDKLSNLVVLNLRSNNIQSDVPKSLCALHSLQVLDLGSNNISGAIPKCFRNLSAITNKNQLHLFVPWANSFVFDKLFLKGRTDAYGTTLGLVTSIDLSANSLTGEIPEELGNLKVLLSLNLSRNLLTGKIPEKIGNIESLESLDFSMNRLSGKIPSSLSHLNFLNHLNLSYNNLTGQIPTSTQLQSFEEFSYIGNHLCGPPVSKSCNANDVVAHNNVTNGGSNEGGSKWSKVNGLYVSIVLGSVMGFWGVVAPLFFIKSWRFAYYQKLDHIGRKFYVLWATSMNKLK